MLSAVTPPPSVRIGCAWLVTAATSGVVGALFLTALETVTAWHRTNPWLLGLLPVFGLLGAWLYQQWGKTASRGTRLLIEESQNPTGRTPFRLTPLIVASTLLTHLGGGSAGREGTALQLGGGIAAGVLGIFRLNPDAARLLLPSGMAAGFGAVFGTPWAAGIFAIECIRPTAQRGHRLLQCIGAAWIGHLVSTACGATHPHFLVSLSTPSQPARWTLIALLCGALMGVLSRGFLFTSHHVAAAFSRIPSPLLRPVVGGILILALSLLTGSRASLGLGAQPMDPGDPSIASCFSDNLIPPWAWAGKWLFTVLTLGSGFRGGEVTPLFFIGATAGHSLGAGLGVPPQLMAAAGLASLFAAASRAPISCFILGTELFGWNISPYLFVACFAAFACAQGKGLYSPDR